MNKNEFFKMIEGWPFVILGSLIFTAGLEFFLVPYGMVDGGVVGISIMLAKITGISFSIYLVILNIPFFWLGYKQIGLTFCINTVVAIITVSISSSQMHHFYSGLITDQGILLAIFGGVLMGVGVGVVMRAGGTTDGVEILSLIVSNKTPFNVGTIIMSINAFILLASGFVFGWDKALFSIIAYYLASKTITLVTEGLDKSRAAWIISDKHEEIGKAIQDRLGRAVTYLHAEGGYSGDEKKVVFVVISDLEDTKLKKIVKEIDKHAFLSTGHVHEVKGSNFKKKGIH